ncbi:MAG: hypothetical protein ACI4HQ_01910 [Acetatifactor sp.]
MKLRYYLRGLGIGMVVTALLMGLITRERLPLTDAEIKARARELGMVESSLVQLSDIRQSDNGQQPLESEDGKATASSEPEESASGGTASEATDSGEGSSDETGSGTPGSAAQNTESVVPEPSEQEPSGQKPSGQEPSDGEPQYVTIVVNRGYSSDTVSRILAEAGLVKDAVTFDKYLVDMGYATRISIGTYEIQVGTSEEEIARIITGIK